MRRLANGLGKSSGHDRQIMILKALLVQLMQEFLCSDEISLTKKVEVHLVFSFITR